LLRINFPRLPKVTRQRETDPARPASEIEQPGIRARTACCQEMVEKVLRIRWAIVCIVRRGAGKSVFRKIRCGRPQEVRVIL
jgi:hypothetical protein